MRRPRRHPHEFRLGGLWDWRRGLELRRKARQLASDAAGALFKELAQHPQLLPLEELHHYHHRAQRAEVHHAPERCGACLYGRRGRRRYPRAIARRRESPRGAPETCAGSNSDPSFPSKQIGLNLKTNRSQPSTLRPVGLNPQTNRASPPPLPATCPQASALTNSTATGGAPAMITARPSSPVTP